MQWRSQTLAHAICTNLTMQHTVTGTHANLHVATHTANEAPLYMPTCMTEVLVEERRTV